MYKIKTMCLKIDWSYVKINEIPIFSCCCYCCCCTSCVTFVIVVICNLSSTMIVVTDDAQMCFLGHKVDVMSKKYIKMYD